MKHPLSAKFTQNARVSQFDYGLMEKAQNVFVLTFDFGWSDLAPGARFYLNREKMKPETW